jgi:hypothetical protein
MNHPPVPSRLEAMTLSEQELDKLWHDMNAELMDKRFLQSRHSTKNTYNRGCRGPICRSVTRIYDREISGRTKKVPLKTWYSEQLIEAWEPLVHDNLEAMKQAFLDSLKPTPKPTPEQNTQPQEESDLYVA